MKWNNIVILTVLLSLILTIDCLSQVKIQYDNPQIYARDRSGEIPTFRGHLEEKGFLFIDAGNTKVLMNSDTKQVRTFNFHSVNYEQTSGHYLAFGDNTMFTYMPIEGLFYLMYKINHIYVFELTNSQNSTIRSEMENL